MADELPERISGRVALVVVLTAALFVAGAVIAVARPALLVGGHAHLDPAAHVYAGYVVSRDLALAAALAVPLVLRARRTLIAAVSLAALVQVLDIVVDAATGRLVLLPGLALLTFLLLAAATALSPTPLWCAATWRDPVAAAGPSAPRPPQPTV